MKTIKYSALQIVLAAGLYGQQIDARTQIKNLTMDVLSDVIITGPTNNQCIVYNGSAFVNTACPGSGTGAPTGATYITQTADGSLTAEQALSALATGLLKNTTTTGVLSIAVAADLPAHASRHQNAGGDEVGTATPGPNAIPKADGSNKLAAGWLSEVLALADLTGVSGVRGNGTLVQLGAGAAPATNDCAKFDANGNIVTAGAACGTGGGGSTLPVADTTSIIEGSADATKELRFEVDGFTTGTVRVLTPQNEDYVLAGTNITNNFTAVQNSIIDIAGTTSTSAHFMLRGATNTQELLALGFDTTANFGWIQADDSGTSVRPLVLQPNTGTVQVGKSGSSSSLEMWGSITAGTADVYQIGTGASRFASVSVGISDATATQTSIIRHYDSGAAPAGTNFETRATLSGTNTKLWIEDPADAKLIEFMRLDGGAAADKADLYVDLLPNADLSQKLGQTGRRWDQLWAREVRMDSCVGSGCPAGGAYEDIDVEAHGAIADDGIDDLAAIQAAVNALHARGGCVAFPSGKVFHISGPIVLGNGTTSAESTKHYPCLRGRNSGFRPPSGVTAGNEGPASIVALNAMASMVSVQGPLLKPMIEGLRFDGANVVSKVIDLQHIHGGIFKNLYLERWTTQAMWLQVRSGSGVLYGACHNYLENVVAYVPGSSGASGFWMEDGCSNVFIETYWMFGGASGTGGIVLKNADNNHFSFTQAHSGTFSGCTTNCGGIYLIQGSGGNAVYPSDNTWYSYIPIGTNNIAVGGTAGTRGMNRVMDLTFSDCGGTCGWVVKDGIDVHNLDGREFLSQKRAISYGNTALTDPTILINHQSLAVGHPSDNNNGGMIEFRWNNNQSAWLRNVASDAIMFGVNTAGITPVDRFFVEADGDICVTNGAATRTCGVAAGTAVVVGGCTMNFNRGLLTSTSGC